MELLLEIKAKDGILIGTLTIDSKQYKIEEAMEEHADMRILELAKIIYAADQICEKYSVNTKK